MYKITYFDDLITKKLVSDDAEKQAARTPSGKLSASMLGEPLQWQILKTLAIGTRVLDPYVLRKFARGNDTEDWYVEQLGDAVVEKQKLVEYRKAIGYVDTMVKIEVSGKPEVVLPCEIKSVSNAKFKNIVRRGSADEHHLLQAAFYALATKNDNFAITYIAAEDYRTLTWVFKTKDYQDEVDRIITAYDSQLSRKEVPIFVARYQWQAKLEYNKYPEWMTLNQDEINLAMQVHYPQAWEKLK